MTNLFRAEDLGIWLGELQQRAATDVAAADREMIRFNPEEVIGKIVEQWDVEEVTLKWDSLASDAVRTIQIPIDEFGESYVANGFALKLYVPFTGSVRLFNMRASTRSHSPTPEGEVSGNTLILDVKQTSGDATAMKAAINQLQASINQNLEWSNLDVSRWHSVLRSGVQEAVAARKVSLDMAASLSNELAIPLHATSSNAVKIPVQRKAIRPIAPSVTSAAVTTDPAISEAIYEDVIQTLRSVGNSFERLPKTAARFDEEELRDVLLFILNSNYEGAASGEVFNGAGKTDILIRHRDRNAFIGECKIWYGQKAFGEAIDQLLSYTVWRDTKAALILFVRGGDATAVIEKAHMSIKGHANFVSERKSSDPEVRSDYLMRATDDGDRNIRVALLPIVVRATGEE